MIHFAINAFQIFYIMAVVSMKTDNIYLAQGIDILMWKKYTTLHQLYPGGKEIQQICVLFHSIMTFSRFWNHYNMETCVFHRFFLYCIYSQNNNINLLFFFHPRHIITIKCYICTTHLIMNFNIFNPSNNGHWSFSKNF